MKRNRESDETPLKDVACLLSEEPNSKKTNNAGLDSSPVSYYLKEGHIYFAGKDYEEAMKLFMKGAEEGCVECEHKIGYLYDCGLGVLKDYSKAMEWYLKSASVWSKSQYNIGILYENGKGVPQDFSKAMEWYLKAAENNHAKAQFNIGQMYHTGFEVEKDYSKAIEWYLKAGNNDHIEAQYNVGVLYLNGERGIEKDLKKAIFWMTKCLNDHFDLIETPYEQFALKDFTISEETSTTKIIGNETDQVIVRFEERDFTFPNNYLEKSKYLSTMMSDNWKDLNEKDGNQIILDLRPIQKDIYIFQEPSNHIQIFENYLNYLTNNSTLLALDMDAKFKLIELSRYLGDDECILNIVKEATLLMRFYILLKMERVEPLHIAIASCFATGPSFAINDLSENIVELLLNQSEITSKAKQNIVEAFTNKFKKYPNDTHFGKSIHGFYCLSF